MVFRLRVDLGDGAGARPFEESEEYEISRHLLNQLKVLKAALRKVRELRRKMTGPPEHLG